MNYSLSKSTAFPIAEVTLSRGEEIRIESGAMAYHNGGVELEGNLNSGGSGGVGGFFKALGRSVVSGESIFITTVTGIAENGVIALAPHSPGAIKELKIGDTQWRIQDSSFLACDGSVSYELKRQSISKALFGSTGGFFVMETSGAGTMLVTSYGDILELEVDGRRPLIVDNMHVVAWSTSLDYEIKVASGMFGFKSGEGLVNEFNGFGTVLIQTRNIEALVGILRPFFPSGD